MIRFRHRRRLRTFRFLAVAAPDCCCRPDRGRICVSGPLVVGWLRAPEPVCRLLLGGAMLRLDRRWRVAYAAGRAAQAARSAAEYERYTSEHRSFTAHMIELLDAASDRIGIQRMTLDLLEAEIADLRSDHPPATETRLGRSRSLGRRSPCSATSRSGGSSGPTWPMLPPSSISSRGMSEPSPPARSNRLTTSSSGRPDH